MIGAGLRILVVGAGISGLGAARALRQRGLAADVVEREPAWTHTGAGIYLPGNATRALRTLGLESAVAERAAPIPYQRLCDHRGNLLADIDTAALWGDVGPCLALHRADLHAVLAFSRRSHPGPEGCVAAAAQPAGRHRNRRIRRRQRRPL
jgi:FAD-dependent urate hydroxylase